jgi:hypothetical protein
MIELVVIFCLSVQPDVCKERPLAYFEHDVTPMQLMMHAQPEIAKWIEGHPGFFAKRWSVRPAGLHAKA